MVGLGELYMHKLLNKPDVSQCSPADRKELALPLGWGELLIHTELNINLYFKVKPLGVIWGKFSEFYSKKNTIMFDDIGRNFLMNPQNGLKVRQFYLL